MDINCPYCGAHYALDDSLLPEGDIKVKCRVCSNVFILSKNFGAFKAESPAASPEALTPAVQAVQAPSEQTAEHHSASDSLPDSPQAQASGSAPASLEPPKHQYSVSDDFMKSIMSEINSAVAEETGVGGKHKKGSGSGSDAASAPSSSFSSGGKGKESKGRASTFQIIMLIILAVVFLIAAASALVHYNIINIPFLPSGVSDFLSSF